MTTTHTEKTSAAASVGAPTPQDYEKFWGDRIVRTGVRGLGAGLGAGALYYLARSLSDAARQRAQAAEEKEQAQLMGEEKVSNSAYDKLTEAIGKMLPNSPTSLLRPFTPDAGGGPNTFDPSVTRSSFGIGATVGSGALGGLAGWKLIHALHSRKKKMDQQQEVDDAEQEYHNALVGKSAALDTVYSSMGDKQAAFETITGLWDALKRVPSAVGGAGVLAGMGSGALAAKLMYDRAKDRSRAKAVEEAAKSRARIAGILPTYVDPDEISALKQQVQNAQAG
jgi:membrane protein YqaA with SNARE-associated domain